MIVGLLALVAVLLGCDSSPTAADDVQECAQMSEDLCIHSATCTLILETPSVYACRASADECELEFRQALDSADVCEEDSQCSFAPGQCYCAPGVTCVCSGGPPPQCTLVL